MDAGGESKGEARADFRAERKSHLQLQGGARAWMSERRNGLARGILNRLHVEGRSTDRPILNEVQICLGAKFNHGEFSATS